MLFSATAYSLASPIATLYYIAPRKCLCGPGLIPPFNTTLEERYAIPAHCIRRAESLRTAGLISQYAGRHFHSSKLNSVGHTCHTMPCPNVQVPTQRTTPRFAVPEMMVLSSQKENKTRNKPLFPTLNPPSPRTRHS